MGGGSIKIFHRKNFVSQFRTFPQGRGESFSVSLVSGIEKCYGYEGGEEYQQFPSKNVCLTVPKFYVGGNLLVFQYFRVPKNFWIRWGAGVTRFSVEIFLSHRAESFCR